MTALRAEREFWNTSPEEHSNQSFAGAGVASRYSILQRYIISMSMSMSTHKCESCFLQFSIKTTRERVFLAPQIVSRQFIASHFEGNARRAFYGQKPNIFSLNVFATLRIGYLVARYSRLHYNNYESDCQPSARNETTSRYVAVICRKRMKHSFLTLYIVVHLFLQTTSQ